jgi:hypothetical protein
VNHHKAVPGTRGPGNSGRNLHAQGPFIEQGSANLDQKLHAASSITELWLFIHPTE